jgi:putative endonuclease
VLDEEGHKNRASRSKARDNQVVTYYVYILECADDTLYVGCTNNLERRLLQHNQSKGGAHYTKIRRPVVLKYSEMFATLAEARRREAEIKSWKREKKLALFVK